jgi:hypothetical protein
LFARPFLQLQAEAVLLHLENGEVVFSHQVDDGFDIFEFQRRFLSGVGETLGKAVLTAGSSHRFDRIAPQVLPAIIKNPPQLRADDEVIDGEGRAVRAGAHR